MATIEKIEDLNTWKEARKLCVSINEIMKNTELNSDYGLKNQINRSSGSIMDNIAEGFGRGGNKEFIQFLSIAKGSCEETKSQIYRCYDREYISSTKLEELLAQSNLVSNKIGSFIKYLKKVEHNGIKFK